MQPITTPPVDQAPRAPDVAPVTFFAPSTTNPRPLPSYASVKELAEQIAAYGVKQPVLARPREGAKPGEPPYELVFGQRRWVACCGLAEEGRNPHGLCIPFTLERLSDEQVLALQAIENIGHEPLHPLDECAHYLRMMQDGDTPLGPTAVAHLLRVDVKRVERRLELVPLCDAGREAFRAGRITEPLARVVARMAPALQGEVLEHVANWGGEPMGEKAARAFVRDRFTLRLAQAPFDAADGTLVPPAGTCGACPKRTGANPQLWEDVGEADVCTDITCFNAKKAAQHERLVDELRTSGYTVLQGDEARAACTADGRSLKGGFVAVDAMVPAALGDGTLSVAEVMARAQAPHADTCVIDHPSGPAVLHAVRTDRLEAALRKIKAHRSQLDAAAARKSPRSSARASAQDSFGGTGGKQEAGGEPAAAPAPAAGAAAGDEAPEPIAPGVDDELLDKLLRFKPPPTVAGLYQGQSAKAYASKQQARARGILVAARIASEVMLNSGECELPHGIGHLFAIGMLYGDLILECTEIAELCDLDPPASNKLDDRIAWLRDLSIDEANLVALVMLALQPCDLDDDAFGSFAPEVATAMLVSTEGIDERAQAVVAECMQLGAIEQGEKGKGTTAKKKAGAKVQAKYRDPATGATWSGRGLQPKWLKVKLEAGHKLEEFAL